MMNANEFYTCRRCGDRIDKKYLTEVVTHHHYAVAEKSYLCQSCHKLFIRFMEGKIFDSEKTDLKIAIERKRRKQRKSMAKDAVEMETDLVYESDEENYE